MDEQIKYAVEYIAPNFERWEIERGLWSIGMRSPLPNDTEMKICDLLDEYGNDNDLPEDWWMELCDIEDVFFELCEIVN